MDFFAAQTRARIKTRQLVALLVAAVAFLIISSYAVLACLRALVAYYYEPALPVTFWQPGLLVFLTILTTGLIGGASWWKWRQLREDGLIIIKSLGARWISHGADDIIERRLLNIVEEMAIASGVPVPSVFILDDENAINAFAAGLTPQDAAVAVTRGALEQLSRDELQGVIGHEFSHILNNDTRMNTILMAVVHGLLFVGLTGEGIFKDWGKFEDSPLYIAKYVGAIIRIPFGLIVCAFGYAGYFLGRLIVATISRQREYLSDAAAIQFTRNPVGLTGALRKIGLNGGVVVTNKVREIRHFFFVEACENHFGAWFATHPLWLDRVRAIDAQAARIIVSDALEHGRLVMDDSPDRPGLVRMATDSTGRTLSKKSTPHPAYDSRAAAFGNDGGSASLPAAVVIEASTAPAELVAKARRLLSEIDPSLLNAAHQTESATGLVLGLLIDRDPDVRRAQWDSLTYLSGAPLKTIERLEPALLAIPVEHRLPLLQLALPTLRRMPGQDVSRFWHAADKLAQCDGHVSVFEYALLRMVQRHLVAVAAVPVKKTKTGNILHSEIGADAGIVLCILARCGDADEVTAKLAFNIGKKQLAQFAPFAIWRETQPSFRALDGALDRLAAGPPETKHTVLTAAEAVVMADGKRRIEEIELLRMISDSLGRPMPLA